MLRHVYTSSHWLGVLPGTLQKKADCSSVRGSRYGIDLWIPKRDSDIRDAVSSRHVRFGKTERCSAVEQSLRLQGMSLGTLSHSGDLPCSPRLPERAAPRGRREHLLSVNVGVCWGVEDFSLRKECSLGDTRVFLLCCGKRHCWCVGVIPITTSRSGSCRRACAAARQREWRLLCSAWSEVQKYLSQSVKWIF